MAAAIQQLNARLQQQETAVTILTTERESLALQVQSLTGTPGQRVRTGVVDTRVIGKPDQFEGDPHEVRGFVVQTEIAPRSRGPTVSRRVGDDRRRLNATLDSEGSALSTQMYNILVMTTAGAALDKWHNAGVNEGFEAWGQFVMEWEPKLWTR